MGRRFCVRCGVEEDENTPIIDGLCPKHFVEERRIVSFPSKITIVVCPSCGSVLVGNDWLPTDGSIAKALEIYINKALVKRSSIYPGFTDVEVNVDKVVSDKAFYRVKGRYGKHVLEQDGTLLFEVKHKLCPICSSIRNESYEATVQIRSEGPPRYEVFRRIADRVTELKEFSNVVKIEESHDGVDLRVRDPSSARLIASVLKKEFSAHVKQTWKDYGYLGGKKHGKLTISARVPGLLPGDVVVFDEDLYTVVGLSRKGIIFLRRLSDGRMLSVKRDELWSKGFQVLTGKDYAIVEGRLLNYEGGKAVVQAVDSGNIYYVSSPKILDLGSRVKILIYKGIPYLLI